MLIPAENYTITRFAADGGWGSPVAAHCSGTDLITCADYGVPEGKWQYADTPNYGSSWVGTPSVRSAPVTVDTTPPVVAVGSLVSGNTYGANWTGSITGSAGDAGAGVVGVRVSVQNAATGLWWNGAAFAAGDESFLAATGTTSWRFALPSSALTSGTGYRVKAEATDGSENVGISALTAFVFDNASPVVVIGYPMSGNAYGPNWSGAISGTVADPDANLTGVNLSITDITAGAWWNGTDWQSTVASVAATGTAAWNYPLASGALTDEHRYAVVATATDAVGNTGFSTATSFQVDVATLSVAVTYPVTTGAYGGNWTGIVAGTVADSHPNLTRVTLTIADLTAATTYWTGHEWSATPSTVTASGTASWTYSLVSIQLSGGHHYTVTARALDLAGNSGTSSAATWIYDDTAPTSVITSPMTGTGYGTNWAGSLTGAAAAGAGLTVAGVTLTIENLSAATYWTGSTWTSTPSGVLADGTSNWTYPVPSTILTSGDSYAARAIVTDLLGNATTSIVQWTYNTTPPVVAVSSPIAGGNYGANWSGTITGTAGAGATAVTVSVQNAATGLWWNGAAFAGTAQTFLPVSGTASWTYPLAASALSTGTSYVVTANAIDDARNADTSGATTFSFTTTAPHGAITYPVAGTTYGANWAGMITGTAAVGSGLTVAGVTLAIENTSAATYWTGSTWTSTPTTVSAAGSAGWSYPLVAANLTNATYAVTATITDDAGNTTAGSPSTWTYLAAPGKLKITTPVVSGAASGAASLGPITVQAQDSLGTPITAPAGGISVALSSNSTGNAVFSTSSGGVATTSALIPAGSSGVSVYYGDTRAGTPVITVAAAGVSSASQTATITAAAPNKLAFGQQPTNTPRSGDFTPTVTVLVLDQFGNLTPSTASVTLAIQSGPSAGSLSGGKSRPGVGGVATFPGLSISGGGSAGTYVLQATGAGLVSASSNSFAILDR